MDNLQKFVSYVQDAMKQTTAKPLSSPPSTSSGCISGGSEEECSDGLDKLNDSLGSIVSAETYLNLPEDVLLLSSVRDIENAIATCKAMVLEKGEDSDERKWLIRRLIELRLRLQEVREANQQRVMLDAANENNRVLLGHHFVLQNFPLSTAKYYCDRCSGIIWNVIHSWYLCTDCDYKCHVRCLSQVCRVCAHVLVSENPKYELEICPEAIDGLANQNYRCAECSTHTSFTNSRTIGFRAIASMGQLSASGDGVLEPRLCDYNGKFYCPTCHWNSTSVIPARVIYNWDFKERRVCRSSKQILKLMSKLPVLRLEELNPVLFASIEELTTIKVLRNQLLQIKKYLTLCKAALESHLIWQVGDRVHFIENESSYSLQDLLDLKSGELLQYLNKLRKSFIRHIKVDCEVCYGRGYCCELCSDKSVIFPFETNVVSCPKCQSAFHFSCWVKINQQCRKCDRIEHRLSNIDDSGSIQIEPVNTFGS